MDAKELIKQYKAGKRNFAGTNMEECNLPIKANLVQARIR